MHELPILRQTISEEWVDNTFVSYPPLVLAEEGRSSWQIHCCSKAYHFRELWVGTLMVVTGIFFWGGGIDYWIMWCKFQILGDTLKRSEKGRWFQTATPPPCGSAAFGP